MSVCGPVANGVPKTDNGTRNGKHTKVCERLVRTYPAFDGSCFPIHIRLQSFSYYSDSRPGLALPAAGESLGKHCESLQRPHSSLPADRGDFGTPALALLHYRRRSCCLR